jgi:acyl-CoA synthetase (AMP-forming)/AMP-acid ligase II
MIITSGENVYPIEAERGLIAHFKCPTWVEFVGTLPRKATGKLLKRSLRKQFPGATTAVSR